MPANKNSSKGELPIDSPERRRLPPLLRRAWYSLNQAFRRRIIHLDITPDQFTALRILGEHDQKGLSQRQLTELMSSDPNTVASLVERMETNGLLQRRQHETDKRANRIKLRAKGKKTYAAARQIAIALQQEVLMALPSDQRDGFLTELAAVAEACRNAAEESIRREPP
jgi:DNA-binding MarR family transcriptional regulator